MRLLNGFAVGFVAAGLVGCSSPKAQSLLAGATPGPAAVTSTAPPAAPVSTKMQTGARTAAAQFYDLYAASQFSALWNRLTPAAKRQVSEEAWVSVHDACPGTATGKPRIIKAVTAFGSAAIITEAIAGTAPAEDVFSYVGGQWRYSPSDIGIYRRGSIAADVAAAKSAGFCTGWKVF